MNRLTFDLYFFSYTGTCENLAFEIAKKFVCKPKRIQCQDRSYLIWLFLSFFPYFTVSVEFPPQESNKGLLIFPKWTFNCPPVTSFLKRSKFDKLLLIITYGGWGELTYAHHYQKYASKYCKEVDFFLVKKREWQESRDKVFLSVSKKIEKYFR
ncbi:MAG: hypothetical protein N2327_03750 [Caldimicrobium sp.]|nr:hypothetical protein [Caldimicrobium sp.]MCX7873532.1 hypothetical protein [Caldimicrobium sp.]MDW8094689.1 hypothetical protein [Caldimicrobium sp.]